MKFVILFAISALLSFVWLYVMHTPDRKEALALVGKVLIVSMIAVSAVAACVFLSLNVNLKVI